MLYVLILFSYLCYLFLYYLVDLNHRHYFTDLFGPELHPYWERAKPK